ncbi:MAG: cupin domain-containing protein [Moorea sp. SIO4G2]|nr:cupin domain-containing protein [Moorena sp. SIO4G2]
MSKFLVGIPMNVSTKSTAFYLASSFLLTLGISFPAEAHFGFDFHQHGQEDSLTVTSSSIDISDFLNGPIPTPITDYLAGLDDTSSTSLFYQDLETAWVAGGRISFVETGETTDEEYTLLDVVVVPGGGTPLHFHEDEAEWFFMLDGTLEFQLEDQTALTPPETLIFGPQNGKHAFRNQTSDLARLLIYYEPTGVEDFFREVGQPVTDPFNQPPVNPEELLEAAPANGLIFPSSLEFAGNQFFTEKGSSVATVDVIRTGAVEDIVGGSIFLGTGTEIPIEFGIGESFQSIDIPLPDDIKTIDLFLKNPTGGAFIGLLADQAIISTISIPESSFPVGLLAFGAIGAGLMLTNRKSNQWNVERHFMLNSSKTKSYKTV